jgi:hypothetical protein
VSDVRSYMSRHGAQLADNGYHVLPVAPGFKYPGDCKAGKWFPMADWDRFCDRTTRPYEIDIWSQWPGCAVGIAAGAVVGIDIDVLDADAAHAIEALAREMLGDTPAKCVGRAPKRMLVYRSAAPFPGIKRHPLEVLCRGQQFVAYAIHPDTGQPYQWVGDGGDLTALDVSRLPEITEAQAHAFLDAAWPMVPVELRQARLTGAPATTGGGSPSEARGTVPAVTDAMRFIPNADVNWDDWIRIGLAIKAALGEDGQDLWLDWCSQSSKDAPAFSLKQWASFHPTSIGAGSIYHLARQAGWQCPPDMIMNATAAEQADAPHPAAGLIDEAVRRQTASEAPVEGEQPEVDHDAMLRYLDAFAVAGLDIPPEVQYMGDVLTDSRRIFLVGSTGLGKSQLAHALGAGFASANGFLGWHTDVAARVLIIDGEMSTKTLKNRMGAALRRDARVPEGNLLVFAADRAEEFERLFPGLGKFEPLNMPGGRQFLINLINVVKPDVVIFDNVMSLTTGDQKDEVTWKNAEPLIKQLTARGIGQIWLDHTGHNRDRQYGANAKAWIMDAVGIMTAQPDNGNGVVSFKLSFNYPGKARHRCEENEADYSDRIIRLKGDVWETEAAGKAKEISDAITATANRKALMAGAVKVLEAKGTDHTTEGGAKVRGAKVADWRAHTLDSLPEDATPKERNAKRVAFDRAIDDLQHTQGAITTEGEGRKSVFWIPGEEDFEDEEDC